MIQGVLIQCHVNNHHQDIYHVYIKMILAPLFWPFSSQQFLISLLWNILPVWAIFMHENGGGLFHSNALSRGCFFPALLPWFVYSNLPQNVSRSFINPVHRTLCNAAISRMLSVRTYVLASRRKFDMPHHLPWAEQYTGHLSCEHDLVQTNKFTG